MAHEFVYNQIAVFSWRRQLLNLQAKTTPINYYQWNDGFTCRWCHYLRIREKVIRAFLEGNDVFISLATGSGKSLCYAVLPYAFDDLRGRDSSIVIVICPLKALVRDQVF